MKNKGDKGDNTQEPNMKWLQIPNHPFKIMIVACSESLKANALLTLIKQQPEMDKIFFMSNIYMNQNISIS